MWYIQGNMISKVFIAALLFMVFSLFLPKLKKSTPVAHLFSALVSSAVLFVFSPKLTAFYFAYVIMTYIMVLLMGRIKKARKICFVSMCILCVVPFVLWRVYDFSNTFIGSLTLIGFSYNMLKAVDALFYVYYTDEKIPVLSYANFILFFPVFTSGPIFRYRDFSKQFNNLKPVTLDDVNYGIKRFILGMFKKVVLVTVFTTAFDHLAIITEFHWYSSLAILFLAYILLYADLSGYSDMAIGMGRLMGITIPENFNKPWQAASFTQFWRKWHITLSDWIREHIFVVIQGKKLSKFHSAAIGMATMIIMSLWHGFSTMEVINGIYMGSFLVIENLFSLSTFNVRKEKKYKFYIRCFFVSFFFAVNALMFHFDLPKIFAILKGLIH